MNLNTNHKYYKTIHFRGYWLMQFHGDEDFLTRRWQECLKLFEDGELEGVFDIGCDWENNHITFQCKVEGTTDFMRSIGKNILEKMEYGSYMSFRTPWGEILYRVKSDYFKKLDELAVLETCVSN